MKIVRAYVFACFCLLFCISCLDDEFENTPYSLVEPIRSGKKRTLTKGSSPLEVYSQLQELEEEKSFHTVSIVGRRPYSSLGEIETILPYYRSITIKTTSGLGKQVVISFDQEKVSSIEVGGVLLEAGSFWPSNFNDGEAIALNDNRELVYEKLLSICEKAPYSDYQIIFPDKHISDDFDPDMANYNEWALEYQNCDLNDLSESERSYYIKYQESRMRLFFENQQLVKILHEYHETVLTK